MAKRMVSDNEANIIIKRYSDFHYRRENLMKNGKTQYEADIELKSEISNLLSATKIFEDARYNSIKYEKVCLMIYGHLREIKYKIRFYELGLYDNQGVALLQVGNLNNKSLNLIKEIDSLIKEVYGVYKSNERLMSIKQKVEDGLENGFILQMKRVTQDLADLYYFKNDIEGAILFYDEAFENYASIKAGMQLVWIYTNIEEFENIDQAEYYYQTLLEFEYDEVNFKNQIMMKCMAVSYMYHYYYNRGDYPNAYLIATEAKAREDELNTLDEFNEICDGFISKCFEMKEKQSNPVVENKNLEQYFSNSCINLMGNDIKTFVQTSINLYEVLNESQITMDYSSVNIPILKGIEAILFKIFADEYLKYLKTLDKIDFKQLEKSFYYEKKQQLYLKSTLEKLEYGSAVHAACDVIRDSKSNTVSYLPKKYFIDFCSSICKLDDAEKVVVEFVTILDSIREIRNKTAHRFRVEREDADNCRNQLYVETKFIEYIYDKFKAVLAQK